jgi:hypothetical protein
MHKSFFFNFSLPCSRENKWKVSACFFENTNSKKISESRISLFRLSFAGIGLFFPVYTVHTYIHGRLPKQFSGSQAVFGQILESQAAIGKTSVPDLDLQVFGPPGS